MEREGSTHPTMLSRMRFNLAKRVDPVVNGSNPPSAKLLLRMRKVASSP